MLRMNLGFIDQLPKPPEQDPAKPFNHQILVLANEEAIRYLVSGIQEKGLTHIPCWILLPNCTVFTEENFEKLFFFKPKAILIKQ